MSFKLLHLLLFSAVGLGTNGQVSWDKKPMELLHDLAQEVSAMKLNHQSELASMRLQHQSELALISLELQSQGELLQTLLKEKATVEERVEYLEAITRGIVPRTCHDLFKLGVSKSGKYLVDPDGPGIGDPPVTVTCSMDSSKGSTIISHDIQVPVQIEHCEDPGCFQLDVTYEASAKQIKALMDISEDCSQSIRYDCFAAPLAESGNINMAWWLGRSGGQPNYYWDGSHGPGDHLCACETLGDCVNANYPCNCDSSFPTWLADEGTLTDTESLPVTGLRFGGLVFPQQGATVQLGPLVCSSRQNFLATESCATLQLAGHSRSGYFWVDGPSGINYDLVQCNMDLDPDDPGHQVATSVKLAQYPVAFRAQLSVVSGEPEEILLFDNVLLNEGSAFDGPSSTFTAPLDGIYFFTVYYVERDSSTINTYLDLFVNDTRVTRSYGYASSDGDRGTDGSSVVLRLSSGDMVYARGAGPKSKLYNSQFSGYLILPL